MGLGDGVGVGMGWGIIEHEMCVLTFTTTFFKNISHSEENSAGVSKNKHKSLCRSIHYCQIVIRFEFLRHIFEEYSILIS